MPGRGKLKLAPKNTSLPPSIINRQFLIPNQGGNKLISNNLVFSGFMFIIHFCVLWHRLCPLYKFRKNIKIHPYCELDLVKNINKDFANK